MAYMRDQHNAPYVNDYTQIGYGSHSDLSVVQPPSNQPSGWESSVGPAGGTSWQRSSGDNAYNYENGGREPQRDFQQTGGAGYESGGHTEGYGSSWPGGEGRTGGQLQSSVRGGGGGQGLGEGRDSGGAQWQGQERDDSGIHWQGQGRGSMGGDVDSHWAGQGREQSGAQRLGLGGDDGGCQRQDQGREVSGTRLGQVVDDSGPYRQGQGRDDSGIHWQGQGRSTSDSQWQDQVGDKSGIHWQGQGRSTSDNQWQDQVGDKSGIHWQGQGRSTSDSQWQDKVGDKSGLHWEGRGGGNSDSQWQDKVGDKSGLHWEGRGGGNSDSQWQDQGGDKSGLHWEGQGRGNIGIHWEGQGRGNSDSQWQDQGGDKSGLHWEGQGRGNSGIQWEGQGRGNSDSQWQDQGGDKSGLHWEGQGRGNSAIHRQDQGGDKSGLHWEGQGKDNSSIHWEGQGRGNSDSQWQDQGGDKSGLHWEGKDNSSIHWQGRGRGNSGIHWEGQGRGNSVIHRQDQGGDNSDHQWQDQRGDKSGIRWQGQERDNSDGKGVNNIGAEWQDKGRGQTDIRRPGQENTAGFGRGRGLGIRVAPGTVGVDSAGIDDTSSDVARCESGSYVSGGVKTRGVSGLHGPFGRNERILGQRGSRVDSSGVGRDVEVASSLGGGGSRPWRGRGGSERGRGGGELGRGGDELERGRGGSTLGRGGGLGGSELGRGGGRGGSGLGRGVGRGGSGLGRGRGGGQGDSELTRGGGGDLDESELGRGGGGGLGGSGLGRGVGRGGSGLGRGVGRGGSGLGRGGGRDLDESKLGRGVGRGGSGLGRGVGRGGSGLGRGGSGGDLDESKLGMGVGRGGSGLGRGVGRGGSGLGRGRGEGQGDNEFGVGVGRGGSGLGMGVGRGGSGLGRGVGRGGSGLGRGRGEGQGDNELGMGVDGGRPRRSSSPAAIDDTADEASEQGNDNEPPPEWSRASLVMQLKKWQAFAKEFDIGNAVSNVENSLTASKARLLKLNFDCKFLAKCGNNSIFTAVLKVYRLTTKNKLTEDFVFLARGQGLNKKIAKRNCYEDAYKVLLNSSVEEIMSLKETSEATVRQEVQQQFKTHPQECIARLKGDAVGNLEEDNKEPEKKRNSSGAAAEPAAKRSKQAELIMAMILSDNDNAFLAPTKRIDVVNPSDPLVDKLQMLKQLLKEEGITKLHIVPKIDQLSYKATIHIQNVYRFEDAVPAVGLESSPPVYCEIYFDGVFITRGTPDVQKHIAAHNAYSNLAGLLFSKPLNVLAKNPRIWNPYMALDADVLHVVTKYHGKDNDCFMTSNLSNMKQMMRSTPDVKIPIEQMVIIEYEADKNIKNEFKSLELSATRNLMLLECETLHNPDLTFTCTISLQGKILATQVDSTANGAKRLCSEVVMNNLKKTQNVIYVKSEFTGRTIMTSDLLSNAKKKKELGEPPATIFKKKTDHKEDPAEEKEKQGGQASLPENVIDKSLFPWIAAAVYEILDEYYKKITLEYLIVDLEDMPKPHRDIVSSCAAKMGLRMVTKSNTSLRNSYVGTHLRRTVTAQDMDKILQLHGGESGRYKLVSCKNPLSKEQLEKFRNQCLEQHKKLVDARTNDTPDEHPEPSSEVGSQSGKSGASHNKTSTGNNTQQAKNIPTGHFSHRAPETPQSLTNRSKSDHRFPAPSGRSIRPLMMSDARPRMNPFPYGRYPFNRF